MSASKLTISAKLRPTQVKFEPKTDWAKNFVHWIGTFLPILNLSNSKVNCGYCSLAVDEILSHGLPGGKTENLKPVPAECANLITFPQYDKNKKIISSYTIDARLMQRCLPMRHDLTVTPIFVEDESSADGFRLHVDRTDKPIEDKLSLYGTHKEKVNAVLKKYQRRAGSGAWDNAKTTHGFIILTHKKQPEDPNVLRDAHVIIFVVGPKCEGTEEEVLFIDAQSNCIYNKLPMKHYVDEVFHIRSIPPEYIPIKKEKPEDDSRDIKVKLEGREGAEDSGAGSPERKLSMEVEESSDAKERNEVQERGKRETRKRKERVETSQSSTEDDLAISRALSETEIPAKRQRTTLTRKKKSMNLFPVAEAIETENESDTPVLVREKASEAAAESVAQERKHKKEKMQTKKQQNPNHEFRKIQENSKTQLVLDFLTPSKTAQINQNIQKLIKSLSVDTCDTWMSNLANVFAMYKDSDRKSNIRISLFTLSRRNTLLQKGLDSRLILYNVIIKERWDIMHRLFVFMRKKSQLTAQNFQVATLCGLLLSDMPVKKIEKYLQQINADQTNIVNKELRRFFHPWGAIHHPITPATVLWYSRVKDRAQKMQILSHFKPIFPEEPKSSVTSPPSEPSLPLSLSKQLETLMKDLSNPPAYLEADEKNKLEQEALTFKFNAMETESTFILKPEMSLEDDIEPDGNSRSLDLDDNLFKEFPFDEPSVGAGHVDNGSGSGHQKMETEP